MLKIAVFGSEGFVGKNVVKGLEKKFEIIPSDVIDSTQPHYIKADITNPQEVSKVIDGCDVVVHLAAHQLGPSMTQPILNASINIIGTLNILQAAKEESVKKVIFSSASSVVGMVKQNPVKEDHPCEPKTPYAVAKLSCENYCRVFNEVFGIDYLIFRFFNIYGPYQINGIIPNTITSIKSRAPIKITGDGSQTRDFVYIGDFIPILEKAISGEAKNSIVNFGTGHGISILEVVKMIGKVLGVEPNISWQPASKGEISNFVADTKKLENLFGITPQTSLKEGLRKIVNFK
jgi:UDP-glucose 4-epimerase